MLGRGLIANPELAHQYKNSREISAPDLERLKAFHNELFPHHADNAAMDNKTVKPIYIAR
jgi:hypothetical protein